MNLKLNTQDRLELIQLLNQCSSDENEADIIKSIYDNVNFSDEEKEKLKIKITPESYRFEFLQEGIFEFENEKENNFLYNLYDFINKSKLINLRNYNLIKNLKLLKKE
jgi:hypothetical protein